MRSIVRMTKNLGLRKANSREDELPSPLSGSGGLLGVGHDPRAIYERPKTPTNYPSDREKPKRVPISFPTAKVEGVTGFTRMASRRNSAFH